MCSCMSEQRTGEGREGGKNNEFPSSPTFPSANRMETNRRVFFTALSQKKVQRYAGTDARTHEDTRRTEIRSQQQQLHSCGLLAREKEGSFLPF